MKIKSDFSGLSGSKTNCKGSKGVQWFCTLLHTEKQTNIQTKKHWKCVLTHTQSSPAWSVCFPAGRFVFTEHKNAVLNHCWWWTHSYFCMLKALPAHMTDITAGHRTLKRKNVFGRVLPSAFSSFSRPLKINLQSLVSWTLHLLSFFGQSCETDVSHCGGICLHSHLRYVRCRNFDKVKRSRDDPCAELHNSSAAGGSAGSLTDFSSRQEKEHCSWDVRKSS